jgi:hypothetical protein
LNILLFLLIGVCSIAAWFVWPSLPVSSEQQHIRELTTALAGMNATMLGFLVSAGALIYAIAQTSLVKNLQRTGHIKRLLGTLFLDAFLFFLALCSALYCLLVVHDIENIRALVTLNVAALAGLIPFGYTLWNLLIASGPSDKTLELP